MKYFSMVDLLKYYCRLEETFGATVMLTTFFLDDKGYYVENATVLIIGLKGQF